MFSALRQGSLFYILNKGENPKIKVGQVVSVSSPMPKYGQSYIQPHESVVDISVKVNDETMNFQKVPSELSIVDFGQGTVISDSREAMNAEIEAMLRTSRSILDSIPHHETIVEACDSMLRELNPQFDKEKKQEEKISDLEQKMTSIEKSLENMTELLTKALSTSNKK